MMPGHPLFFVLAWASVVRLASDHLSINVGRYPILSMYFAIQTAATFGFIPYGQRLQSASIWWEDSYGSGVWKWRSHVDDNLGITKSLKHTEDFADLAILGTVYLARVFKS
jgi:hypothetical protein